MLRKLILIFAGIIAIILFIGFAVSAFFLFTNYTQLPDISTLPSHIWWTIYSPQTGTSLLWKLVGIAGLQLFSIIAGFILLWFYIKTSSFEIFFFTLFLFTLSLEGARILQLFIQLEAQPTYFGVVVTRFIYFARLFDLCMIFLASLLSTGIKNQKIGFQLGISFLLSFFLAYTIPIDTLDMSSDLLYQAGDERNLAFLCITAQVFAVLNLFVSGILKQHKNYSYMGIGVLLALTGRELIFFLTNPVTIASSLALLITGAVIFTIYANSLYLWSERNLQF